MVCEHDFFIIGNLATHLNFNVRGSFGDIKDRENFYQIEPLDSKDTTVSHHVPVCYTALC
jgi:hypothetical protein